MRPIAASLLALTLVATPAAADMTVRVVPGPLDGAKIQTPWGSYVALFEGNQIWVGTEAEYEALHAATVAGDHGAAELCRIGQRHCGEFVEGDLPRAVVGRTRVGSITVGAAYEGARSSASAGKDGVPMETATVTWVQAGSNRIRPMIIVSKGRLSYSPISCGIDAGIHHCEFTIPAGKMAEPAAITFLTPNAPPALVAGRSVAWLAFDSISEHVRSQRREKHPVAPSDPEDASYRDVRRLHQLDPTVPETPE